MVGVVSGEIGREIGRLLIAILVLIILKFIDLNFCKLGRIHIRTFVICELT